MQSQYDVVFTGELKPGFDKETVIKAFSERFQVAEAKAAEILGAGKAITMKSAVAKEVAEKFQQTLEALGMTVRLESQSAPPATQATTDTANPYQTPQANLQQHPQDGEMSGPVSVPFGHGASWIGSAWRNHFTNNPIAWIGTFLVFVVLSLAIQLVPLLGALAITLLSPVFTAGFLIGSRAQDRGENFTVGHLFSGFKQSTGQLIMVGVLYLVAMLIVGVIAAIMMGGSFTMLGMMAGDQASAEAMMQDPATIMLPLLVMMLLFIPVLMAYWFAPALVALDGVSALNGMKLSFIGCMKNTLSLLLYSIVLIVLMFIAVLPFGLGLLIMLPVMMASMYTSYRDIYHPNA